MRLLLSITPPPICVCVCHRGVRNWPVYGCNYVFMSIFVSLLEGLCARVFMRHADDSVCVCVNACVRERKCVHCEL